MGKYVPIYNLKPILLQRSLNYTFIFSPFYIVEVFFCIVSQILNSLILTRSYMHHILRGKCCYGARVVLRSQSRGSQAGSVVLFSFLSERNENIRATPMKAPPSK
jgi:hypothetical protein